MKYAIRTFLLSLTLTGSLFAGSPEEAEVAYKEISYYAKTYPPLRRLDYDKRISVTQYGARPDDAQCDFQSISKALEQAASLTKENPKLKVAVSLPRGTYYFGKQLEFSVKRPRPEPDTTILKVGSRIGLLGNGSTIIIRDARYRFVEFRNTRFSIVQDFTIQYLPSASAQGTIVSVDKANRTAVMKIDPGFPQKLDWGYLDTGGKHYIYPRDPDHPGRIIKGRSNVFVNRDKKTVATNLGNGLVEFNTLGPQKGDRVAFSKSGGRLMSVVRSKFITFKNINVLNCPGACIGGGENIRMALIGVKLVKPKGHLICSGRDSVIVKANTIGHWIEDCTLGNGGDDVINHFSLPERPIFITEILSPHTFRSSSWFAMGRRLVKGKGFIPSYQVRLAQIEKGAELNIFHRTKGLLAVAKVTGIVDRGHKVKAGETGTKPDGRTITVSVDLKRLLEKHGIDSVKDVVCVRPETASNGMVVLNSRIENSRRVGMLMSGTRNVLVQGNTFIGNGGVAYSSASTVNQGNIVLADNTFEENHYGVTSSDKDLVIEIAAPSLNREKVGAGNRLLLYGGDTHGVFILDNTFKVSETDIPHRYFQVRNTHGILFQNNQFLQLNGDPKTVDFQKLSAYAFDRSCTGVTFSPSTAEKATGRISAELFERYIKPHAARTAVPGETLEGFKSYQLNKE